MLLQRPEQALWTRMLAAQVLCSECIKVRHQSSSQWFAVLVTYYERLCYANFTVVYAALTWLPACNLVAVKTSCTTRAWLVKLRMYFECQAGSQSCATGPE